MIQTDLMLHQASQYLASFGIQYLPKRDDDSHTNLAWNSENATFKSRTTDNGQALILHATDLTLEWTYGDHNHTLNLIGRSHGEICVWLHHIALRCGLEEYDFYLHYTLDSGRIRPDHLFDHFNPGRAQELSQYRNSAQEVCEAIQAHFELDTEIRVWPHHFDTGGYSPMPGSNISIGFGMAIPDSVEPDYYFYCSGYHEGQLMETKGMGQLDHGEWKNGDFKGAVLPLGNSSSNDRVSFLKQSIASLAAAKQ